jgi:hypothetical protein
MDIQTQIDNLPANGKLHLKPGEIKGPIQIRKSCSIEGSNTILWNHHGPVIEIFATPVHLKSLRIEVSDNAHNNTETAIEIHGKNLPTLENVEVRGLIKGIIEEAGTWDYPTLIDVNDIPSNQKNVQVISIISPIVCRVVSETSGVSFSNNILQRGFNNIIMNIEPVAANTIISGNIFIESKVRRRIRIQGIVSDKAPIRDIVYPIKQKSSNWKQLDKGERITLSINLIHPKISLEISNQMNWQLLLAFLYLSEKKLDGTFDSEIVVHDISLNSSEKTAKLIPIYLDKIHKKYSNIHIVAGFTHESNMASFQEFPSIPFRIWNDMDQEQYLFDINAITSQILTIGEFYRYKDTWRFKTIGEGYRGDWKTLQKEYHITFPENGHIMKL